MTSATGRSIRLGLLVGLAALLVVDAIAMRIGMGTGAIPTLAGPSLWITSRAAGTTAFLALTLDMVFGLFISTGAADRWIPRARTVEIHRWLSTVSLSLTAVHALALLGARFDILELTVPFITDVRPFTVGLGVLAAWAAVAVHVSFDWRKRLGNKTWRRLHYVSFAAFAAAVVHARHPVYHVIGALVVLFTLARFILPRASASRASRSTGPRNRAAP